MIFKLNSAEKLVNSILTGVVNNDGFCPCQVIKSEGSKCNFNADYLPEEVELEEMCKNGQEKGECCCNLYQRVEE